MRSDAGHRAGIIGAAVSIGAATTSTSTGTLTRTPTSTIIGRTIPHTGKASGTTTRTSRRNLATTTSVAEPRTGWITAAAAAIRCSSLAAPGKPTSAIAAAEPIVRMLAIEAAAIGPTPAAVATGLTPAAVATGLTLGAVATGQALAAVRPTGRHRAEAAVVAATARSIMFSPERPPTRKRRAAGPALAAGVVVRARAAVVAEHGLAGVEAERGAVGG